MFQINKFAVFLLPILICASTEVLAQSGEEERPGVVTELLFTNDTFGIVSGGIKKGSTNLSNLDFTIDVDTERSGLWEHGKFFSYFLAQFGGVPSQFSGELQPVSNIEADDNLRLLELYYAQEFFDGKLVLLGGLHNYNADFYLSNYAGALINASFGEGQESSQAGAPSLPDSSLALQLGIKPTENTYALAGLFEGNPGNPNVRGKGSMRLRRSDGVYYAMEAGLNSSEEEAAENLYKVAFGAWMHDSDFEDFKGDDREDNYGYYFILDKSLFHEEDAAQGLGCFLQLGYAQGDRNQTDRYIGAGLSYTGLIPGRDEDTLALGMARAENSSSFRALDPLSADAETVIELTYRIPLKSWLTIQPDIQYVIKPGASKEFDDALALGLRVQIGL